MIIFCQSFISKKTYDDPKLARQAAVVFANEVENIPFESYQPTRPRVINISETATRWGNSVTVWYRADKKVEA
ncbi:MAG TPA: hypothetical protein ENH82_18295 [bacterium]|nr:hypothetical protein [bacterium]